MNSTVMYCSWTNKAKLILGGFDFVLMIENDIEVLSLSADINISLYLAFYSHICLYRLHFQLVTI
jgi:hypothetical protein